MSCGVCYYCIRGDQLLCNDFTQLGIHTNGTYAEYVKAPAYLVHHLPDALSFEEGAFIEPLSCCIHAAKGCQCACGRQHGDCRVRLVCCTPAWQCCVPAPRSSSWRQRQAPAHRQGNGRGLHHRYQRGG